MACWTTPNHSFISSHEGDTTPECGWELQGENKSNIFNMKGLVLVLGLLVGCSNGKIDILSKLQESSNTLEKNIPSSYFSISVNPATVQAILDEMANFTIAVNRTDWGDEDVEVM